MCGILGALSSRPIDATWMIQGLSKLSHRGPDFQDIWSSDDMKCHLGHARLSIIDLSDNARQPMHILNKSYSIVFNGEIYNYLELREELIKSGCVFITNSDTEVILQLYHMHGIDFVHYLKGMFALCIIDKINQKAFLFRDRAGEKPLYYSLQNSILNFSSEIKALLINKSFKYDIDLASFDYLLSFGYVPRDKSIYKQCFKLPAGHFLVYDLKNSDIHLKKYWEIPKQDLETNIENNNSIFVTKIKEILTSSVDKQLHADVPVGVLLSGGLDSSIIVGIASRLKKNVSTYTVSFSGSKNYDESLYARNIASFFKTNHTEIQGAEIKPDILDKLSIQFDEPMIDSSMLPTYLVSNVISKYCKVAIGGDGGDELFGGYNHYSDLLSFNSVVDKIPNFIRKSISHLSKNILPIGFKGKYWFETLGQDYKNSLPIYSGIFPVDYRKKLILNTITLPLSAEHERAQMISKSKTLLRRVLELDFYNYLSEDILVKVDRSSMLNSLEIRAPFLDVDLIEFMFKNVPDNLKASKSNKKIILKEIAKELLPPNYDYNRKHGFGVPFGEWIKYGIWRDYFFDNIFCNDLRIFNKSEVKKIYNSHLSGNNNSERLFAILLIELWANNYLKQ